MADTITLNYDFVKPEPGASEDTWGDKLNANWDSVDAVIKALDTRVVTNKNKGDTNATNIAANLVKINTNISQINAVKARATALENGPLRPLAGSLAAPAYSYASDSNSGWLSGGNGILDASINGTRVFRITSSVISYRDFTVASGYEFNGSGAGLTALNASNVASGTLNAARLPASERMTESNVAAAMASRTPGEVGTYCLMAYTGSSSNSPGTVRSGSLLRYANADGETPIGGPPSTSQWVCAGYSDNNSARDRVTSWLRRS